MTALYILSGVALVIALVALLRISLTISYSGLSDGEVKLYAGVLFFKYDILAERPAKKETPSKKRKAGKVKKARVKAGGDGKKGGKQDISGLIFFAAELVKILYSKLRKILRLRRVRIAVSVGGSDPSAAATMFGTISSACAAMLEFLGEHFNCKYKSVSIYPDFMSETVKADISVRFSASVGGLISLGAITAYRYVKHRFGDNKNESTEIKEVQHG